MRKSAGMLWEISSEVMNILLDGFDRCDFRDTLFHQLIWRNFSFIGNDGFYDVERPRLLGCVRHYLSRAVTEEIALNLHISRNSSVRNHKAVPTIK